jgi:hypothetical protein
VGDRGKTVDHSQSHPADERFGEEFVEVEVPKAPSRSVVAFSCIALATVAAVIGAVSYYAHASYQKALANEAKLKADRAVNQLTPGTQEAWTAYVDRRVAAGLPRALLNFVKRSLP